MFPLMVAAVLDKDFTGGTRIPIKDGHVPRFRFNMAYRLQDRV